MSLPTLPPNDDYIYDLKAYNGKTWWQKGNKLSLSGLKTETQQPVINVKPIKKYMLIMAGQSNCQSSNNGPLTEEEKQGDPRIKAYYRGIKTSFDGKVITNYNVLPKGSIGPAIDPLQHHGISDPNSVGFGISFCKEFLKDHPDSEITIVPCALGGTGFNPSTGFVITWDKTIQNANLNLYNEMISSCNSVLQTTPDMEVLGCLWHQGENDVGNWNYPNKLDTLVKDLRNDLHNGKGKDIPFICGTMLKSWKDMNKQATDYIDMAHKQIKWRVTDKRTDCTWFDWITLPPYEDGMKVHYIASAQRMMGFGFYGTYKSMMGIESTKEITMGSSRDISSDESGTELSVDMGFDQICKKLMENEGKC